MKTTLGVSTNSNSAMAQYTAYLLHFTAPLHLGNSRDDYGVSLQTLGSDGLYAALTATLSTMGVAIPDDGDLGCTVSSLFPFYQKHEDDEPMLFFPNKSNEWNGSTNRHSSCPSLGKTSFRSESRECMASFSPPRNSHSTNPS